MRGYYKKASPLPISVMQRTILEQIVQRHTSRQDHARRACLILLSSAGLGIGQVSAQVGADRKTVSTWRKRWLIHQESLKVMEAQVDSRALSEAVLSILSDAPRTGTPVTYSAQVVAQVVALSCEDPKACGYPTCLMSQHGEAGQPLDASSLTRRSHRTRYSQGHFPSQCGAFFKRRPILNRIKSAIGNVPPIWIEKPFTKKVKRSVPYINLPLPFTKKACMSSAQMKRQAYRPKNVPC